MPHFPRLGKVEEPVRAPGSVCAVERRAVLDGDEHVLEAMPLGTVVVHVARRDDTQTHFGGHLISKERGVHNGKNETALDGLGR
jgi:hypothetical protein